MVLTESYQISEAGVRIKSTREPQVLLIVQHGKAPKRYCTISHPTLTLSVGEGKDLKYTVDSYHDVLIIQHKDQRIEERFKDLIGF